MNVLIVDDDRNKIDRIKELMLDSGVQAHSIYEARDAVTARANLEERPFEIVLLDVLLPARLGGTPRGDVSADLLREMFEDGVLRHPAVVVGITADIRAQAEHWQEFAELTSAIILIEAGNDRWKQPLKQVVNARRQQLAGPRKHDYDICVINALRDPEWSAFLQASGVIWSSEERVFSGVRAMFGEYIVGTKALKVVCAHSYGMGMVAATSLSEKLLARFSPKYLVMTGFCGGIGGDLKLGDLVVAEKAWDWQSGKHESEGFASGVDQKDACPDLIAAARKVAAELAHKHGANARAVHFAPMVSGSSIIADVGMHDHFKSQHRKVAAVDMEAYGVYYAASLSEPSAKVFCVKGVADLADVAKSDNIQLECSQAAAKFMMEVIVVAVSEL